MKFTDADDPVCLIILATLTAISITYLYDAFYPGPTIWQPLELYETYTKNN